MKQIQVSRTGIPSEVVECVEVDDPVISALGDVRVRIEAFPINPADLLTLQGYYPRSNPDSRTLGVEALGCVEAVGPSVTDLAPGDRRPSSRRGTPTGGRDGGRRVLATNAREFRLRPVADERARTRNGPTFRRGSASGNRCECR
jgi:NADPH:quinone reductase-like Zn-dependent oxidoreductase